MFHRQIATELRGAARGVCAVLGLAVLGLWAERAEAQQFHMNVGCPTMADANLGNYTIDQMNELCHNQPPSSQSGATGTQTATNSGGGNALTCGQHRALAFSARINPGFVEGETSQVIVDKYCDPQGKPDSAMPQGSYSGGDEITRSFKFERGYYTQYSGAKKRICQPYYSGNARVSNGRVEFTSGGHTWRGIITDNSYISITRDGVTPRPKNPTSIQGPMFEAELYNGYCGRGFFRLTEG